MDMNIFDRNLDAAWLDNGEVTGVPLINGHDFWKCLKETSTILFPSDSLSKTSVQDIIEKVHISLSNKKQIFLPRKVKEVIDSFFCIPNDSISIYESENNYIKNVLAQNTVLECPVVVIAMMEETINTLGIELSLREFLENDGYQVTQILGSTVDVLPSMETFPYHIFFDTPPEKAAYNFLVYLRTLEDRDNPDVILLTIPYAWMSLIRKDKNFSASEYALLEISDVVQPDYMFMLIPYNSYTIDDLRHLHEKMSDFKQWSIDCFALDNVLITETPEQNREYVYFPLTDIDCEIENLQLFDEKFDVFNLNRTDAMKKAYEKMLNKLSDYKDYFF